MNIDYGWMDSLQGISNRDRFSAAIREMDAVNSHDPNRQSWQGESWPLELLHSVRMTHWQFRLQERPSEALLLAGRGQHIGRWEVPRNSYPEGRASYLKWRHDLKQMHARKNSEILERLGYDEPSRVRVRELNLKSDIKNDQEGVVLEDALCLVFLETRFADMSARTDREKMVAVVRKTWAKMSEKGHELALTLPLDGMMQDIVREALK